MPVQARFVINASGLGAAHVAMMVGANNFTMEPRKGEYLVLAKSEAKKANHVLFQVFFIYLFLFYFSVLLKEVKAFWFLLLFMAIY